MASSSSRSKNLQDPWEVLEVPTLINLSVKNASNDGDKDQTKSKKVPFVFAISHHTKLHTIKVSQFILCFFRNIFWDIYYQSRAPVPVIRTLV